MGKFEESREVSKVGLLEYPRWLILDCEASDMKRVNPFWFYLAGKSLGRVQNLPLVPTSPTDASDLLLLLNAESHLNGAVYGDDTIPLRTAIPASKALFDKLSEAYKHLSKELTGGADAEGEGDASSPGMFKLARAGIRRRNLNEAMQKFENVLESDLQHLPVYFVPQRGGYDTATLADAGDSLIPGETREYVPPVAREDMKQAARCLAFNTATAAGFHALRAAEVMIRGYYRAIAKTEMDLKNRNWGNYIDQLRKNHADENILSFLTFMKDRWRNPIVHPEAVLTTDSAIELLGAVVSAICMLVEAITRAGGFVNPTSESEP